MNDTAKRFFQIAIPYLVGAAMGIGAVVLFVVAGLRADNRQLAVDLKQQRAAFASASTALESSQQQLKSAVAALDDSRASNSELKQQLGRSQAAISGLSGQLDRAKSLIDSLTKSGGELGSGAAESIRLATNAANAVRSALKILAGSQIGQ